MEGDGTSAEIKVVLWCSRVEVEDCCLSSDITFITGIKSSLVNSNECHFDEDKNRNVFELQKVFWVITSYNLSCVNSPLLLFQLS